MKTGEPHRHVAWTWVRAALVAMNAVSGLVAPHETAVPPMSWTAVLVVTAFALFGTIIMIAGHPLLPDQAPPSWRANPFSLRQPVQFFHMGAWMFMAYGVGGLIAVLVRSGTMLPETFLPLTMGGALWAATRVIPPVRRHEPPDGTEAAE